MRLLVQIAALFSLFAFAAGCGHDIELEPLPEPEPVLAHGEPCEVVLEDDGSINAVTDGGNFLCADDGTTLLFCGCDDWQNGDECPEQVGTLAAQSLIDDCTCGEWFEGRCPVE